MKLIRNERLPLWELVHSKEDLEDAKAQDYSSYLLNYEGHEEAFDPNQAAYKFFSDQQWPQGNIGQFDYIAGWKDIDGVGAPVVSCDFNRSPHCWGFFQPQPDGYVIFDELVNDDALTREQAEDAVDILKKWEISHVIFKGDHTSTGSYGRTGTTDWQTIYHIFDRMGITYKKVFGRSNPDRKDRVETINNVIYSGEDERGEPRRRFIVNPRCEEVIADYKYSVVDDNGVKKARQGHRGHLSDAIDYGIFSFEQGSTWKYVYL